MSFLEKWEQITNKFPGQIGESIEDVVDSVLSQPPLLEKRLNEFIKTFWLALNNRVIPLSSAFVDTQLWQFDTKMLLFVERVWSSMLYYVDIFGFRAQSMLMGRFFYLSFQLPEVMPDDEAAPQGAFIKNVKAKTRKVAFNVLSSRNMKTSFVYNPMITPILRETIMKKGIVACAPGASSTLLAPCRSSLAPAPLERYPTDIIFRLISSSRDEPVIDIACFSDYLNIKHKFVEVGRVERAGLPYICVSYFFNKVVGSRIMQPKTLTLGSIPSKYYFDFTWLVVGKNRFTHSGWRTIVQPPQKQDTSSSAPLTGGFGYETYLDKYEEDFIMRIFLNHDKGDVYSITQVDILLTEKPRDIIWQNYLTSI